jgi:nickel/cobalt exporter
MPDLVHLLQHGQASLWIFIPSAILLGALHGLEPGHSKTMMAAFIVAVRGTVWQAILLGLSATASHTLVVWLVALGGLYFGRNLNIETSEPWFQLGSAAIILAVAAWMVWRTWSEARAETREHGHDHAHHHHHHDEAQRIDTGHGLLELSIFETGAPPRFRLIAVDGHLPYAGEITVTTTREDGGEQAFHFASHGDYLESREEIPEPHAFTARLDITYGGHAHEFDVIFAEDERAHDALDLATSGFQDAHERAHANDIRRRFAGREVTTGQIVLFGLTGGLIPCPASITVLLLCLQLKQIALGAGLVLCFSIGLAATMVSVGVIAALGVQHAERRWSGAFSTFAKRAPYASAGLIAAVAVVLGVQATMALAG